MEEITFFGQNLMCVHAVCLYTVGFYWQNVMLFYLLAVQPANKPTGKHTHNSTLHCDCQVNWPLNGH